MGAHDREPLRCVEDLRDVAVLGGIDDHAFVFEILYPLLGEGSPDDVSGEVLHSVGGSGLATKQLLRGEEV